VFGLFGLLFIAYGIVSLVKRDWMWALTKMGNDFDGQVSQRNELWELRTMISGVVAIVIGIVLILLPTPAVPVSPFPPIPEIWTPGPE